MPYAHITSLRLDVERRLSTPTSLAGVARSKEWIAVALLRPGHGQPLDEKVSDPPHNPPTRGLYTESCRSESGNVGSEVVVFGPKGRSQGVFLGKFRGSRCFVGGGFLMGRVP